MSDQPTTIITFASSKGGTGKTTLAMLFASVALSNNLNVLLIDCDPQGSLKHWSENAKANELWPESSQCRHSLNVEEIVGWLDEADETGEYDLVCLDTPGFGDELLEELILASDHVVAPIKCSETDLAATKRFYDWFMAFKSRVSDPEALPTLLYVVNDVDKADVEKLSKPEKKALQRIRLTLPTTRTPVRHYKDYRSMAEYGPLYGLAINREKSAFQGMRITARSAHTALNHAADVMNEVLRSETYETGKLEDEA